MFTFKLHLFATEIMHRKPQFTAFGLFDIDNTLFLTVSIIIFFIDLYLLLKCDNNIM